MNKVQMSESLLNTRGGGTPTPGQRGFDPPLERLGPLAARRVGRRRERRFERADLERFLGQTTGKGLEVPTATLAVGGVSIPLRGHFAPHLQHR